MFVVHPALNHYLHDFLAVVLFNDIFNTNIVPSSMAFSIFDFF